MSLHTLPTAEILSGKNARAFLVCGFLMKSFKKIPCKHEKDCGSRLEVTISSPFYPYWAGLVVLFIRQLLNGSQDFFLVLVF